MKQFQKIAFFIICKISKFENNKSDEKESDLKSYLACNDIYGTSMLVIDLDLPVGKWIEIHDVELRYDIRPFFGGGIQNEIKIMPGYGLHTIKDGDQFINLESITNIAQKYVKSIQIVIDYKKAHDEYKDLGYRPLIFDSMTHLLKSSRNMNKFTLLCRVDGNNHVKSISKGNWNYTFNVNAENVKFSIIKWRDCRDYAKFVGDYIKPKAVVIFIGLAAAVLGRDRKYLKIQPNSYILYDFCTDIQDLLIHGTFAQEIVEDIHYLWSPESTQIDKLIYKQVTLPRFANFDAAQQYAENHADEKLISIFTLPSSLIESVRDQDCIFKHYCNQCNSVYTGLYAKCCGPPVILTSTWIEGTVTIDFAYPEGPNSDQKVIGSRSVIMSMDSIKVMYNYCQLKDIHDKHLNDVTPFITECIEGKLKYSADVQANQFEPLIKVFWDEIQKDKSKQLCFEVSSRRGGNGIFWTKLRFRGTEVNSEQYPTPKNDNKENNNSSKKRKLSNDDNNKFLDPPKKKKKQNQI